LTVVLAFVFGPGMALAASSAPVTSEHDVATLVTDRDAAEPGHDLGVGLRLQMKPGWHTYWVNPGDAGEAPTLSVTVGGGATGQAHEIVWPTPVRISEGGLMSYAYTGDVLLPEVLSLKDAGSGDVTVKAHAEWLVCASVCVPEQGDFTLTVPRGAGAASAEAGLFRAAAAGKPAASPFAAVITPDGVLGLSGAGLSAASVKEAWFMPSVGGVIDQVAGQKLSVSEGRLTLALKWAAGAHHDAPLSGIVVLKDGAGQESPLWVEAKPGSVPSAGAGGVSAGVVRVLLFAFLGGLILNLMPCVFPILAMKALSLAKMGATHRRAQVTSAGFYTMGVVLAFLALGVALLALRAAGSVAGWGFQFQSPGFVVGVCWLLFVMALNLLGVFEITTGSIGQSVQPKSGHWGDALTGLLAVVVATPCTAPFMGVAIAGALTGPVWVGLAVFASLGIGLAFPYLAIALVPALARAMPKPGAWMGVLRQALAFPLLGTCVWLLWVASLQRGADVVAWAAAGMVFLGMASWAFGAAQAGTMRDGSRGSLLAWRGVSVVAFLLAGGAFAGVLAVPGGAAVAPARAGSGVEAFSEGRVASLRAAGRPVFVDMTAGWCITCMVNERVALDAASVKEAFAARHVAYVKGDWTNRDPAISAYLRAHGRDGVPLYVYYPAHGEGEVLPQILSPGMVLGVLDGKAPG